VFNSLTTPRLSLRELGQSDAASIFEYRSAPEVSRYQNWEPHTVDEVRDFISSLSYPAFTEAGEWSQLGITLRESGVIIGDCGVRISGPDSQLAEIGISLNPAFQGHGFASEALHALLKHLFSEIGVHRIIGSVDPRNSASIALMKRIGMRQEAHYIESYWFKGDWADDIIFAILKREWVDA